MSGYANGHPTTDAHTPILPDTTDSFDRIERALRANGSKITNQRDSSFMAQCPAHDDGNPSLAVTRAKDSTLIHCFAGCDHSQILDAIGLQPRDLFDDPGNLPRYRYSDEHGDLNRWVERKYNQRTGKKTFTQTVKQKGQVILYSLAAVSDTVSKGGTVYFVEGEKDAENGHYLTGKTFTTAPQGAGNVHKADMSPLSGAHVVAIVDLDKAGDDWAGKLAGALDGIAASLEFKHARAGNDLSDHLAAGHTLDELEPYGEVERARPYIRLRPYTEVEETETGWLWQDFIPAHTVTLLSGAGGGGKSLILFNLAAALTRGTLDGIHKGKPATVAYFGMDDSAEHVSRSRARAAGIDLARFYDPVGTVDPETGQTIEGYPAFLTALDQTLREHPVELVILDPATALFTGKNDDAQDVEQFVHALRRICERRHTTVVMIGHTRKGGGRGNEQGLGSTKWRDSSRCMLLAARIPDSNQTVLSVVKTNFGHPGYSLLFEFDSVQLDGRQTSEGVIRLVGVSDIDAEAVSNRAARTFEQEQEAMTAKEWLWEFLTEHGDTPGREVETAGKKEGFSRDQLRRARERLNVRTYKMGEVNGAWIWGLPEDDGTPAHNATFAKFTHSTPTIPQHTNEKSKMAKDGKQGEDATFSQVQEFVDTATENPVEKGEDGKLAFTCPLHATPLDADGACNQCKTLAAAS